MDTTSCCLICFSPISRNAHLSCSDPGCTSTTCLECGHALLEFCSNEKEIPKCPAASCRQHYMLSQIKQLGPGPVATYSALCYDHFVNESKEQLDNKANHKSMIANIRKEKIEFIDSHFPVAIALTIKYALNNKLKTINSKNRTQIKNTLDQMNKKCMNLCCPGRLDESGTCVVCNTTFCEHCECVVHGDNHTCLQENRDSVQFVKTLIKCPTCRLPVIRSWGCNFITCSVCKTNFDYVTGNRTVDGNHQHDRTVLNTSTRASDRFSHPGIDKSLFEEIDQLAPCSPSLTRIIGVLSSVYGKTNTNSSLTNLKIAKEYEVYKQHQYAYKLYYRALANLEEHHVKKTLTNDVLRTILEKIK